MKRIRKIMMTAVVAVTALATFCPLVGIAASHPAVADNESERVLSIQKFDQADKASGQDDGTKNGAAGHQPVGGIVFEVIHYTLNPDKFQYDKSGMVDKTAKPLTLNSDGTVKDPGDYITDGEKVYEMTDKDGFATFNLGNNRSADGIYYVRELTMQERMYAGGGNSVNTEYYGQPITVGGQPINEGHFVNKLSKPFMVYMPMTERGAQESLIYNVKVNPKNELSSIAINKYINALGQTNLSDFAGGKFNWIITIKLPDLSVPWKEDGTGLNFFAGEDPNLSLDANEITVEGYTRPANEAQGSFAFMKGPGQRISLTSLEVTPKFEGSTTTLIKGFIDKDKAAEINKVLPAGERYLKVTIPVTAWEHFNGVLSDNAGLSYQDPTGGGTYLSSVEGVPSYYVEDNNSPEDRTWEEEILAPSDGLNKPTTPVTNTPNYYTGGFDLKKVSADSEKKPLKDATFRIALTKEDAEAGNFVPNREATTDEYGIAQFDGLKLELPPNVKTLSEIKQTYWIVETKAPKDYELLKEAIPVDVTLTTGNTHVDGSPVEFDGDGHQISTPSNRETIEVTIANYKNGELPSTGGQGKTWVIVLALSFMTLSIGTVIYNNRKKTAA